MKPKFVILILGYLLFMQTITSCKKEGNEPDQMKIGMFVNGEGYNDEGYKQNCKEGLLMALNDYSFDTLFTSALTNIQAELDYFPENNFDVLFLAGAINKDELLVTAEKHLDKKFVIIDYSYEGALNNVWSIDYNIDEAAFPIGFLAAAWSVMKDVEAPVVAIVGGMDILPIQRYMIGYQNGILYFNEKYGKNVGVINSIINTFDNADHGYEVTDSLITNQSADVILVAAGNAGNGALYAAKDNGKWAAGTDVDQSVSLPDLSETLLTSCMKRLDTTVYSVAVSFLDDNVEIEKVYTGTLENHGVSMAPFHVFDDEIPDSIQLAIEEIKAGIMDGSIATGF